MFKVVSIALGTLLAFIACDNRNSVSISKPESTYSVDMIAVKDYSQRYDVLEISFWRDSEPFENALIKVGDIVVPSIGGGTYYGESPAISMVEGSNQIAFADTEKTYSKSITIDFPDSFAVTGIFPQDNQSASSVQIIWSQASGATNYILTIVSRGYPANGTTPFTQLLDDGVFSYIVPDTVFEDVSGFPVNDTYFIYLAAFSDGFGEYPGIPFPLPSGLPERRVSDPAGFVRAGIVAPLDSIFVRP